MVEKVMKYCEEHNMLKQHDRIVIGISGGADSVCLFYILLELRERLQLELYGVHVNHGIRGEEAYRDQEYTRALCEKNNVPFFCFETKVEDLAKEYKMSLEEAGRTYRYECFAKVLEQTGALRIAVAHHANDRAETVLFHLVRGSGIRGVAGILPRRGAIIRPLLGCTKEEILAYLSKKEIHYYEDATNLDRVYTRNRIRHEVIPALLTINEKAVDHICDFANIGEESLDYIEQQTNMVYNNLVKQKKDRIFLNVVSLLGEHILIRKQLILKIISQMACSEKDISKVHVEAVLALAKNNVGKQIDLPYGVVVVRDYENLIFKTAIMDGKNYNSSYKLDRLGEYILEDWNAILNINVLPFEKDFKLPKKIYTKAFDYDKIKGDLYLRKRQTGDYIALNTAGQKKTIKKFMIDEKIPKEYRDQIPILATDQGVLWIVGYRSGADYWIDKFTKRILLIEFDTKEKEI